MINSIRLSPILRQLVLKGFPQARTNVSQQCFSRGVCTLSSNEASYKEFFLLNETAQINIIQRRYKRPSKKEGSKQEDEDDEEVDDDEELANENPLLMDDILGASSDGSEKLTIDVNSLRLDAFAKTAFHLTRAKIEEAFYKGEIYVNGEKAPKKSFDLSLEDEIDLVRRINVDDHNKLDISRVQIVKLPDKASEHGRMKIGIKRWMNLTVDPYEQQEE